MTEIAVGEHARYVWGDRRRPHLHPVATPSGRVLTRNAPPDHPWHHGLWFTIKFVNGENFWEEYDAYGVLRHDRQPEADADATIRGELRWIRPDRTTVAMDEVRNLRPITLDAHSYAIDFETALTPRTDTTLDRTPFTTWGGYGGLTLRGRADWHDTRLLVDDGSSHERLLGVPSRWCDLSGTVDGGEAGIAILDWPGNVRHPVTWYASTKADTYGDEGWSNFANAAFLWDGPLEISAGEQLRLRYRVIVHDGAWEPDDVARAYEQWTQP